MACGFSGSNGGISGQAILLSVFLEGIAMAVGFSGSNGGLAQKRRRLSELCDQDTQANTFLWWKNFYAKFPLQMSYFGNNVCNLACGHCYADHVVPGRFGNLSVEKWADIIDQALAMGTRVVGNVGKEPIISRSWFLKQTLPLLQHLRERRRAGLEGAPLIYGLVSNGTQLTQEVGEQLLDVEVDYLDISLDGDREFHDSIRGVGNFDRTILGLATLPDMLREKVFISFTMMKGNPVEGILSLVRKVEELGIKHFLVSPYCTVTRTDEDPLYLDSVEFIGIIEEVLNQYAGEMEFLIKTEPLTSRPVMEALLTRGYIDLSRLFVDTYGTIFTQRSLAGGGKVYCNYYAIPDISFVNQFRVTSNGRVETCYDMFFPWADKLAIGDATSEALSAILARGQEKVFQVCK